MLLPTTNTNVLHFEAKTFSEAYEWEKSVYSFLGNKYDVPTYDQLSFRRVTRYVEGRCCYGDIVGSLGLALDADAEILNFYRYATEYFTMYRATVAVEANKLAVLFHFCKFADEYVALEAKLALS